VSVRLRQRKLWELAAGVAGCRSLSNRDGSMPQPQSAVTYYAYPDSVKTVTMEPKVGSEGSFTECKETTAPAS
jgi:hypothetical protein